jgi:hypothetical protein
MKSTPTNHLSSAEYDALFLPIANEWTVNVSTLFWGMLFGSIGLGFFIYGKKQQAMVPLICGVALMVFPYFVTGTAWLLIIGAALIAIPYFVKV